MQPDWARADPEVDARGRFPGGLAIVPARAFYNTSTADRARGHRRRAADRAFHNAAMHEFGSSSRPHTPVLGTVVTQLHWVDSKSHCGPIRTVQSSLERPWRGIETFNLMAAVHPHRFSRASGNYFGTHSMSVRTRRGIIEQCRDTVDLVFGQVRPLNVCFTVDNSHADWLFTKATGPRRSGLAGPSRRWLQRF